MIGFIVRRFTVSVAVVLGIALVSFIVIQLPPGDYADGYESFLIEQGGATEAEAERQANLFRQRYGLDRPLPIQFYVWIRDMVTKGSFGFSFAYKRDVGELIAERLPRTLLLAVLAHLTSTAVGIIAGIFVAPRQYSVADNVAAFIAFILSALPRFWIALAIMFFLVFTLEQEHVTAFHSPQYVVVPWAFGTVAEARESWAKLVDLLQHIWPVVVIAGLGGVARNMRVMRGNMLDELNAQYVTTARSKGLTEGQVMRRHAVPNALHPIIMYQGTVLPYMLQGELQASIVMGLPTIGTLLLTSLRNEDIYIAASCLLIYGVLLVAGNLIADISLAVLDPRVRFS
ncbi:MAG: ABC transporter permease [Caldilineaceae bacterium]|nr:ABC transporter permease [Caldilineaceae bacterium]MDE0197101.1 ABC transporter permease [Caldilineaceae bacterium]